MRINQVLDKRVLVTDNDIKVSEALAGKIRQYGFKVMTANSGNDALNIYKKFYPDIVIIDEDLKQIDGLELFLKLFFYNPAIKLVLTTRETQSLDKNEFNDSTNFVILKKRFSDEDLKEIFKDAHIIPQTFQEKLQ